MSWRIQINIASSAQLRRRQKLPLNRSWNGSKIRYHLDTSIPNTPNSKLKKQMIIIHPRLTIKRRLSDEVTSAAILDKKIKISTPPSTLILACGQNICGQLGLSTTIIERRKPQRLNIVNKYHANENIQSIHAGAMHSCALTVIGDVYTWGCNDDGALGRITNDIDDEYSPGLVVLPEKIRTLGAGDSFTVALAKSGRAYISGCFRSSEGVLGLFEREQVAQEPVVIPCNQPIKQIACGADFCLLLTENGDLYSFGNNETGQLGRDAQLKSDESSSLWLQPNLIPSFQGQHILNIWAGGHGFFVSTGTSIAHHLYACGANSFGQLGHSSKQAIHTPVDIEQYSLENPIIKVACGLQHTLLLDSLGKVYGLGRRDDGRLGDRSNTDVTSPTQIENLTDILDIAAGGCVSFAIDHHGTIYSFGMGDTCQTGHGSEDIFCPTIVQGRQLEQRTIEQISVGAQHTLFLVRERNGVSGT